MLTDVLSESVLDLSYSALSTYLARSFKYICQQ